MALVIMTVEILLGRSSSVAGFRRGCCRMELLWFVDSHIPEAISLHPYSAFRVAKPQECISCLSWSRPWLWLGPGRVAALHIICSIVSTVVDYDAVRKETAAVFEEKVTEVRGLVGKLQKTQRAVEQALDQYEKVCSR